MTLISTAGKDKVIKVDPSYFCGGVYIIRTLFSFEFPNNSPTLIAPKKTYLFTN